MGRTEEDNAGFLAFKNHWVRQSKPAVSWSFPGVLTLDSARSWELKTAKRVFSCMPDKLVAIAGRLILPPHRVDSQPDGSANGAEHLSVH